MRKKWFRRWQRIGIGLGPWGKVSFFLLNWPPSWINSVSFSAHFSRSIVNGLLIRVGDAKCVQHLSFLIYLCLQYHYFSRFANHVWCNWKNAPITINVPVVYMGWYEVVLRGDYP
jgi:hypothetical protein